MSDELDPIALLSEERFQHAQEIEGLKESLADVQLMLQREDRGWSLLGAKGAEGLDGFDLSELKDVSEKIRPHLVGDSLVARGAALHAGYVWSSGLNIAGVEKKPRGTTSNLRRFYTNKVNQATIFSTLAQEELQKGRYADGNIFLLCDLAAREVRRVPLKEISGIYVNPDFPDEVWAYLRIWNPQDESTDPRKRWYYTNIFTGDKAESIEYSGEDIPVDKTRVIVDRRFNRAPGMVLGVPDAVPAMPWIAAYTHALNNGRTVQEAMAKILYKVTNKTRAGVQNAAVRISSAQGAGNTASMMEGQDLQAISTAGRGYDFTSLSRLASQAAAALNVPTVELLSDSSAAGGSYGAAQTLSPSTKNAMRLMQTEWIAVYEEILDVFGLSSERIWFDPLDAPEPYRAAQQLVLLAPYLHPEETRGKALDLLDIAGDANDIPEIATDTSTGVQAASPDQGQSNGTGGGGSTAANDRRTDAIPEALKQMIDLEFIERLERVANVLAEKGL